MNHKYMDREIPIDEMDNEHLMRTIRLIEKRAREGFIVFIYGGMKKTWWRETSCHGEEALRFLNHDVYVKERERRRENYASVTRVRQQEATRQAEKEQKESELNEKSYARKCLEELKPSEYRPNFKIVWDGSETPWISATEDNLSSVLEWVREMEEHKSPQGEKGSK